MSEPKQISPLLDGFELGNPISDHDGVSCCPAIKENSEEKYIVKIVSIPSSQVQMDALLLTGAYKDASGAMDYFKTVVDDVFREAELLQKLAKLEGFLCYEGWQMEPITRRRLGYEVYLLGGYRRSLDKFVRKNPMTQLEAINLGLDMCAALSVCRQAGALYVDLKPTNIFVSDKKEYRIGDLGFLSMDELSYTALPDKYRSPYTPPELLDPMASVNLTTDTYALGMILYQIYNDGQLPPKDAEGPLPAPVHADYELAEILLRAIAEKPEDRWQDPRELGQALVAYMQRNAVNDVPITPYIPLEEPQQEPAPQAVEEKAPDAPDETPKESEDESAPGEEDADSLLPHEMSDELSRMISKADDLIAHETPEGVVVPEVKPQEDPFSFARDEDADDSGVPLDPVMEEEAPAGPKKKPGTFASQAGKEKAKNFLASALCVALLAGAGSGCVWMYNHLYVQKIDALTLSGSRDRLSVAVDSKVRDSLLTVNCADQYGNVQTQPVNNGQANFSGLLPNTMYTVSLKIDGFHKLAGETSEVFTTDATTQIVSFTSVAGSEDGSLILNFTVSGTEPEQWSMTYTAPGEEPRQVSFSGHSLTVEGLKLGKIYTFTLDAGPELSLSGQNTLEVMASRLILAENLTVSSSGNGDLTVRWRSPGDILVDNWKVRCYNATYEQEFTVQDNEVCFTGIDPAFAYTVEITAAGMTQSAKASVSANPINITGLNVQEPNPQELALSWDYTGPAPEGGWLVLYSVDGAESQNVIKTDIPSAVIAPLTPEAKYRFTIHAADGTTVLSGVRDYTTGKAPNYDANGLTAANVTASLLRTPDNPGWRMANTGADAFTYQFQVGEKISVGLSSDTTFYRPGTGVSVLYVIRDAAGSVLGSLTAQEKHAWSDIWAGPDSTKGQLNLPKAPPYPGNYSLTILVDGAVLAKADFSILP